MTTNAFDTMTIQLELNGELRFAGSIPYATQDLIDEIKDVVKKHTDRTSDVNERFEQLLFGLMEFGVDYAEAKAALSPHVNELIRNVVSESQKRAETLTKAYAEAFKNYDPNAFATGSTGTPGQIILKKYGWTPENFVTRESNVFSAGDLETKA